MVLMISFLTAPFFDKIFIVLINHDIRGGREVTVVGDGCFIFEEITLTHIHPIDNAVLLPKILWVSM